MPSTTEPTTNQPDPMRGAADQLAGTSDVGVVASGLLATLPGPAAAVRRAAFTRLRADRAPATVADLSADTRLEVAGVQDALEVLVGTGTATLDEDGAVTAVGGLSILPAAHQMLLAGHQFWTWCAFDAVGIPAALRVDAVSRTRCGHCGTRLDLTLTAGRPPVGSPVVGWLPGQTCANIQVDFCPQANLFCDDRHLAAWRAGAGHPPGRGATLAELADLGAQVWSEMAAPGGSHESPRPSREGESS